MQYDGTEHKDEEGNANIAPKFKVSFDKIRQGVKISTRAPLKNDRNLLSNLAKENVSNI